MVRHLVYLGMSNLKEDIRSFSIDYLGKLSIKDLRVHMI